MSPGFLRGGSGFNAMPQSGVHAVTVPGAVAGWALLRSVSDACRWGRYWPRHWIAEDGFPVAEITAAEWRNRADFFAKNRPRETFLPDGRAPGLGEIFRNPGLAWTYGQIAEQGAGGFYRGDIARHCWAARAARGSVDRRRSGGVSRRMG